MRKPTKRPNFSPPEMLDIVSNVGATDYVKNGQITMDVPTRSVMINSSADLALLTDYDIGTIAYTAGFKAMYQKGLNGSWVDMLN